MNYLKRILCIAEEKGDEINLLQNFQNNMRERGMEMTYLVLFERKFAGEIRAIQ